MDKTLKRPSFKNNYYNKTYLMPSYFKSLTNDYKIRF